MKAVALSGGADSVAVLYKYKESIDCAIHINYNLRGAESLRDRDFCIDLCKKLGVELDLYEFEDVVEKGRIEGKGLEEYARDLRYSIFEKDKYDKVLLGHHKDDLLETILFRLIRGTGLNGMRPMEKEKGKYLRPLLDYTKKDILDYLDFLGAKYVTDSSNLGCDYDRNIIRNKIVPLMKDINSNAVDNILDFVEKSVTIYEGCKEDNKLIIEELKKGYDLDKLRVITKDKLHMLLLETLRSLDSNIYSLSKGEFKNLIKFINTSESGYVKIGEVYITIYKGTLRLLKNRYITNSLEETEVEVEEIKSKLKSVESVDVLRGNIIINGYTKSYNPEKGLKIRTKVAGDNIKVNGITKKINNYLKENNVYSFERDYVLLLVNGINEVLWVDI